MRTDLLTVEDLASLLHVSKGTLANWRSYGHGPKYTKVGGRVRYPRTEIDQWLKNRTLKRTVPR